MPYLADRSARLFYDDSCGPCRLLARASESLSHHRLTATPLDDPVAEGSLGSLSTEDRFAYAHLARGSELRTGEALVLPLVGLALGERWERFARRLPGLERGLRRVYGGLWEYRRAHGCAAPGHRSRGAR
jgi:hypothetical protein